MYVGPILASKLPNKGNIDPTKFISRKFPNSFMFKSILEQEVCDQIINLKTTKSTIGVPIKCIKIAREHIQTANESIQPILNPRRCS